MPSHSLHLVYKSSTKKYLSLPYSSSLWLLSNEILKRLNFPITNLRKNISFTKSMWWKLRKITAKRALKRIWYILYSVGILCSPNAKVGAITAPALLSFIYHRKINIYSAIPKINNLLSVSLIVPIDRCGCIFINIMACTTIDLKWIDFSTVQHQTYECMS